MEPHIHEWLSLVVRWLHLITGVAWIGASFYFNWLENNLDRKAPRSGLAGHLWAIHGGGFYYLEKYKGAPESLPKDLHWFKWEAYFTWMSGFALLVIVYYWNAKALLIDPAVADLAPWQGIGIGIGTLVVGWLVYDVLCKTKLVTHALAFGVVGFGLAVGVAFGLSQVFSPRGAYIHVGAMLGTIMAANVFHVIIPSQRELVRAAAAGENPKPELGQAALRRSRHNNYITLPVLFIMISSHYPSTYGNQWNWAVLAAISAIGAAVRHYFNIRMMPEKKVWILPVAAAAMMGVFLFTMPAKRQVSAAEGPTPTFVHVAGIISQRCLSCHSSAPTDDIFTTPPNGVTFDTTESILAKIDLIRTRTVVTKDMPLVNKTDMTDQERDILARWIDSGAPLH